jgi:hypothetical protein
MPARPFVTLVHNVGVRVVKALKHHPEKGSPIAPRTFWYSTTLAAPQADGNLGDDGRRVPEGEANLVSSLTESGLQAPIIDLDFPARLVPSSTPGHAHLYIDVEMPWWRYFLLLTGFVLSGTMGSGYYMHSLRRKMTMVRKPDVKKPY